MDSNKKQIKIDYEGTGIKTLKGYGVFFVCVFIALLLTLFYVLFKIADYEEELIIYVPPLIAGALTALFFYAVCSSLSNINKNIHIMRMIKEQDLENKDFKIVE